MMAVAALFMPLLFSCSGGSSSKNNLLGAIPDQYAQFVEEKAQIKKEAENIKASTDATWNVLEPWTEVPAPEKLSACTAGAVVGSA